MTSDANDVLWVADVALDLSGIGVRRVTPDGTGTTLKGDWNTYGLPAVIWVDSSGDLYGTSYPGHTVMKIAWDGTVTLLAGKPGEAGSADGPGDVARFAGPIGMLRDASGLFYIVDSDNHTIRTMRCPQQPDRRPRDEDLARPERVGRAGTTTTGPGARPAAPRR